MNAIHKGKINGFIAFVALTALFTILILLLVWNAYTQAVVRLDEIALNASAYSPWTDWFTSGFSHYFNPYPEISSEATNFIRPITNLYYWLFWKFDIGISNQLIILCYSIHAMIVAIVFLAVSRQSIRDAFFAASAMFLVGSFWPIGLASPVYGSEYLAALLSVLAILSLLNGSRIAAILLMIVSVMTKETSLPIVVGLVVVTILLQDYKTAFWSAIIVAGYFLNRHLNFGSLIGGIYAAPTLTLKSLFTVLTFPISYGSLTELKNTVLALKPANVQFSVALNIVILGLTSHLVYVRRHVCLAILRRIQSELSPQEKSFLIVLVCFAASLAYYVLVARVARFSYQTAAFFFLTLALLPLHSIRRRIILLTFIGNLIGFSQAYTYFNKQNDVDLVQINAAHRLRDFVLNSKTQEQVFTVNDMITGYSKPSDFALIHGSKVDLQKGSSLEVIECPFDALQRIAVSVETVGREIEITTTIPPCANFVFEGANREKMRQSVQGDWLLRNPQISYQFVSDDPNFSLKDFLLTKEPFPRKMIVRVRDASVLYFDFQTNDWQLIE